MVRMVGTVPAPPLMVPALTAGGVEESATMRRACLDVASRLGAGVQRWLVLGADPVTRHVDGGGHGTFLGYGVDVRVSLVPDPVGRARVDLPLPVLIAGWLRGQRAPHVRATAELVDPAMAAADCRVLGEALATRAGADTAVLVVGDGAIAHSERAPGYSDRRAGPFDAEVARAFAHGDPAGLLALDRALAGELHAVGRAPWQVLAGLAVATGSAWDAELLYSDAPYGVGYHVAWWRRAG